MRVFAETIHMNIPSTWLRIISLIIIFILSISVSAAYTMYPINQETISSTLPGLLAPLGDRVVKTTYSDGTIVIQQEKGIFSNLEKAQLNAIGGRIVYATYGYTGQCGSGTSQQYAYYVDAPSTGSWGIIQISCTVPLDQREDFLRDYALKYANVQPQDTIYVNNVLYQDPTTPTPTPTINPTPSPSPSPMPTSTPSSTPILTRIPTPIQTVTTTPIPTITKVSTPTPTYTPIVSPTQTISPTPISTHIVIPITTPPIIDKPINIIKASKPSWRVNFLNRTIIII